MKTQTAEPLLHCQLPYMAVYAKEISIQSKGIV